MVLDLKNPLEGGWMKPFFTICLPHSGGPLTGPRAIVQGAGDRMRQVLGRRCFADAIGYDHFAGQAERLSSEPSKAWTMMTYDDE